MEPIELLQKQLDEYKRALEKSLIAYNEGKISKEDHEKHKTNLTPKIRIYLNAIAALDTYLPYFIKNNITTP